MKRFLCTLSAIIVLTLTATLTGCLDNDKNSSDNKFVGVWECVSITEFSGNESYTYPAPAKTCVLTANQDGTFKVSATYAGETIDRWIYGNWEQNDEGILLSDVIYDDTDYGDENRYTITFEDDTHLTFKIEVEVFDEIVEGTSYQLQKK